MYVHKFCKKMFLISTRVRWHLGCLIHKNSGQKLSKYKADTSDMNQNVFEKNNMDKATVNKCVKRKKA